jgi:hypothetical protein
MASASAIRRVRSDSPVDRWSTEASDAQLHPFDLDQQTAGLSKKRPSLRRRSSRSLVRFLVTFCVGVGATLAWQSYGDVARAMIATSYPQFGWLAPQTAPVVQTAADTVPTEPVIPSPDPQELKTMVLDLAAMRQSVDRLTAQLAAGNQQIAGDIATLQSSQQAILRKISAPPPRPAAPARNAAQLAPPPEAPPVR